MVFASLEDFVNKKVFCHPAQVQKLMPPPSCGNMHIPPNVSCNAGHVGMNSNAGVFRASLLALQREKYDC